MDGAAFYGLIGNPRIILASEVSSRLEASIPEIVAYLFFGEFLFESGLGFLAFY